MMSILVQSQLEKNKIKQFYMLPFFLYKNKTKNILLLVLVIVFVLLCMLDF